MIAGLTIAKAVRNGQSTAVAANRKPERDACSRENNRLS